MITDGEFHRSRTLCEACYRANIDVMSRRQAQDI
jgi:hypothetical protein